MTLQEAVSQFLFHCQYEKNLSPKTLKAYSIDLRQFRTYLETELGVTELDKVDKVALRAYIKSLFGGLAEKSVKRKVATLKALFHHLEREDEIPVNPFRKIDVRIKEKKRLPRTIPLADLEKLFRHLYKMKEQSKDQESQVYRVLVRDIAVLELLFATGARVAEVCNLSTDDVDLRKGQARILGKGGRERICPSGSRRSSEFSKSTFLFHPVRKLATVTSFGIDEGPDFRSNRSGSPCGSVLPAPACSSR